MRCFAVKNACPGPDLLMTALEDALVLSVDVVDVAVVFVGVRCEV